MFLMGITRFLTQKNTLLGQIQMKNPWLTLTKHYCQVADIVRLFSVYEANVLRNATQPPLS